MLLTCLLPLWGVGKPVFADDGKKHVDHTARFSIAPHNVGGSGFAVNHHQSQTAPDSYPQPIESHTPLLSGWYGALQVDSNDWDITLFDKYPSEDQAWLWYQTKVTFGLALGVLGAIALLPESVSKWDKSQIQPTKKWWHNVKAGPVWDTDKWYINYIGHPYFGGVYFVMARSSGYNQWNSLVYSFLMSTFLYEYGVEAMCERPSIQDIIVTPLGGWLYGEWAYRQKLNILDNGSELLGSKALGSTALFLLDPVGNISHWIGGKNNRGTIRNVSFRFRLAPSSTYFSFRREQSPAAGGRYFGMEVFFNF